MVREKNKKRRPAKDKDPDFRKKKVRVGRRISKKQASKYNNVVDTSIHSRDLHIRSREAAHEKQLEQQTVSQSNKEIGLILVKQLPLTDHHNALTRKGALIAITEALDERKARQAKRSNSASFAESAFPKEFLPAIIEKLRNRFLDEEAAVRRQANELLRCLIQEETGSLWNVSPFMELLYLQLLVGLSSLRNGIRLTSLQAINIVMSKHSHLAVNKFKIKLEDSLAAAMKATVELVGGKSMEKQVEACLRANLTFYSLVLKSRKIDPCSEEPEETLPQSLSHTSAAINFYSNQFDFAPFELEGDYDAKGIKTETVEKQKIASLLSHCFSLWKVCTSRSFSEPLRMLSKLFHLLVSLNRSALEQDAIQKGFKQLLRNFPIKFRNSRKFSPRSLEVNARFCYLIQYLSLLQKQQKAVSGFLGTAEGFLCDYLKDAAHRVEKNGEVDDSLEAIISQLLLTYMNSPVSSVALAEVVVDLFLATKEKQSSFLFLRRQVLAKAFCLLSLHQNREESSKPIPALLEQGLKGVIDLSYSDSKISSTTMFGVLCEFLQQQRVPDEKTEPSQLFKELDDYITSRSDVDREGDKNHAIERQLGRTRVRTLLEDLLPRPSERLVQ